MWSTLLHDYIFSVFFFPPLLFPVPPHADVLGYDKSWFVGLENAAVRCVSGGNPKPKTTWIR